LTAMAALPEASVTVHATPGTVRALRGLLDLTIPGVEAWLGERLRWRELSPDVAARVDDARVTPFEVDHGLECVGFRVERGGSTMVYAADTRPCRNVVEHARGADLLIHEAYGTDGDAERAHLFGHSTASEAGRVAREAGARRLVLTHLRTDASVDTEELVAQASATFGRPVAVARDLDAFGF
jgi:ribonuclease BN (tRNA processing enzyme)